MKWYLELWLVWLSGLSASLRTKGSLVSSQLGRMLGLWARYPHQVRGTREATTHWCFPPFLSPLPLSLNINITFKKGNDILNIFHSCNRKVVTYYVYTLVSTNLITSSMLLKYNILKFFQRLLCHVILRLCQLHNFYSVGSIPKAMEFGKLTHSFGP